MNNSNHTRTLHVNFEELALEADYFKFEWTATVIDKLEELSQALQDTLKNKNSKIFLLACDDAAAIIQTLNDSGLKRTVTKLKAHFRNEIKLDDLSFRRNTARLQAIGTMLIEALTSGGLAA